MRDAPEEADYQQLVIHNDEETPWAFVTELLRSVFGKSEIDAAALASPTREGPIAHGHQMAQK